MNVLGVGVESLNKERDVEKRDGRGKMRGNTFKFNKYFERKVRGKTYDDFPSRNSINYTLMLWLQSNETEMTKIELNSCLFVPRNAMSSEREGDREGEKIWNIFWCMKGKKIKLWLSISEHIKKWKNRGGFCLNSLFAIIFQSPPIGLWCFDLDKLFFWLSNVSNKMMWIIQFKAAAIPQRLDVFMRRSREILNWSFACVLWIQNAIMSLDGILRARPLASDTFCREHPAEDL